MRANSVDWSDLLGVPYKPHGRTLAGMDCYGLLMDFEGRFGRTIIDFDYSAKDYRGKEDYPVWLESMKHWEETDTPKYTDALLFFDEKKRVVHAAACVAPNRILHCDVKGARVERLDTFYYQNWKAYKWRQ
ncbi:MAG: C40 family peptidase [Treponema sp.]|nr:C40 family peptidase [Treponema sp.]